jgi:hypothetical protein
MLRLRNSKKKQRLSRLARAVRLSTREDHHIMFISDKHCPPLRRHRGCVVAVSIVALLGLASSARAAIPSVVPQPPVASASASTGDSFGAALSIAELAEASGNAGWLFTVAQTNLLTSLMKAVENTQTAMSAGERNGSATGSRKDRSAPGPQLALAAKDPATFGRILDMTAAPTARSQLAALDSYSQMTGLADRVLQSQSAAVAFDVSLRYLCSDKIYSDLYPNGTGWNNHAYSECRQGGALDPDRTPSTLASRSIPSGPPPGDPGPGVTIIPCGGSIANVSSMTLTGSTTNASTLANTGRAVASLSSFAAPFQFGGGHH